MRPLKSLKPVQLMLTYVMETTEGVHKVNIPVGWKLELGTHLSNGYSTVTVKDQKGSIRLSFMNVLSMRDTATKMQEALIDRENNNEVVWESVESDQSLYRFSREAAQQAFTRRNRTNNQSRNRRPSRAVPPEEVWAEPFFDEL